MKQKPHIVGEGKTETRLMETILDKGEQKRDCCKILQAGSKNQLVRILEPLLNQIPSALILCDCDKGETPERVRLAIEKELKRSGNSRGLPWEELSLQPVAGWDNIFSSTLPESVPTPQIIVHIAVPVSILSEVLGDSSYPFSSTTTDDYILAAALTEGVLAKFAQNKKVGIQPDALQKKVTQEIPALLRKNGIHDLVAKDMNSIYMTVARFYSLESNEAFAQRVVGSVVSNRNEYQQIFASHIAAINLIAQQEPMA